MKYFLTGHTGFKGAWLTLLLKKLGHEVSGFSIDTPDGGLFDRAGLHEDLRHHTLGDVRDVDSLSLALSEAQPDVAIHLAAQSLVIPSFERPIETFTTNVSGTLNFLTSVKASSAVKVALVVTSDKVYRNTTHRTFVEEDPLGGGDPYSASKAMADILAQSWRGLLLETSVHVARAGNVIGAYDTNPHRLVPDICSALEKDEPLTVRNPSHVRPWQHVLDCLGGYLKFIDAALAKNQLPTALNFGPPHESLRSVQDVVDIARPMLSTVQIPDFESDTPEAPTLALDSGRALDILGWQNIFRFTEAVEMSLVGARNGGAREIANAQIESYLSRSVAT